VASEARDAVFAAAERRTPARLVAASRRTPAGARNTVVMIPGRDRARTPVVVMTPRSSWWQSTSERGGGLGIVNLSRGGMLPRSVARWFGAGKSLARL
jgi:hypothetical protein